ncbi:protein BASIC PENTACYSTEINE1-like [Cicer arietinum]|uniref:GAGA-binding transcriptional activator n=1 Tax=Cicer arietinum TaxID=3827 RepID=A0A1S2Z1J0_CICAR|nr:protein BASIC PENTACYSTEINE1-like [Cicer arietinum]XP_004513328.1 protein BASIC PENTACYSTEINE1-like [Cicer arietinum]
MDGDNGLNIRNWGYYEPVSSFKSHLGLQLMSSMPEKPLLGGHNAAVLSGGNGAFHHRDIGLPQTTYPMDYMRDAWISSQRDNKYMNMNMIPTNPGYSGIPETSSAHHIQMIQPPELLKEERPTEDAAPPVVEKTNGTGKKRQGLKVPKSPKAKKPKRGPRDPKDENTRSVPRTPRVPKKTTEIAINGIDLDISSIPIPVCSCTGTPQQCYRWGSGGWQSACCTTAISIYPLPMSTKRRGARIAGRKMSIGAFKKVLEKLAAEGYNFSNPIDLRTYWAKHGTNKFVTIR